MGFLTFLEGNWRTIGVISLIGLIFFCGWHLRGWKEAVRQEREMTQELQAQQKTAGGFEKSLNNINNQYDKLNLQPTYANPYSCLIPADGLRLLSAATR